jgi:RHS repeat-associated protein
MQKNLELHIGMLSVQVDSTFWRGTEEAMHLKSGLGWTIQTSSTAFSGLPAVYRYNDGEFGDIAGNPSTSNISHNYTYDKIGNLITDQGYEKLMVSGGIYALHDVQTHIKWNVYGKVKEVQVLRRPLGGLQFDTTNIVYTYGSDGNRIKKDVFRHNNDPENNTTTFYVRDASGNIMGTYNRDNFKVDEQYKAVYTMAEQPVYGSSRIGLRTGSDTLYTTLFMPGDNRHIEITSNPDEGMAGLHNWITPALRRISVDEDNKFCNCLVRNVNFDNGGVFSSLSNAASFMGSAGNNVSLAEDFNGKLLFYSVVAGDYFGNKDVCLVYDKQGVLMKNSFDIKSSSMAKPMVVKAQGENSKYYLVTVDDNHKPWYHIIDLAQQGYGQGYTAGAVVAKNIPLDNASGLNYGFHMSVIEDNMQRKSLVYMTRYVEPPTPGVEGRTEVVVFDFEPNQATSPVPDVVTSVTGFDKYGEGELQLSPQGNRLAYYNRKRGIAGFAHQEVELHVFGLGKDRKSVDTRDTLSIQGSTAGTAGKASVEFAGENMLLFTQDGLYLSDETFSEKAIWSYRFDTRELRMLPMPVSGDIRHGIDDKIYVAPKGADNKLYTLNNLTTTPNVDTTSSALYRENANYTSVAGGLPMQPYRIAPVSQGIYDRKVGYKQYELTDHLGNVRAVVSDSRQGSYTTGTLASIPNVLSYNDYYAFGMLMPGRNYNSGQYRFGFNGKEMDNDLGSKTGTVYDYGFRIYDARIARFLSVDPLFQSYPWYTPYQFAGNTPVWAIDIDGLEPMVFNSQGFFKYKEKIGENVINVETKEGLKRLTELNVSSKEQRQIMANIIGYYAKEIGIEFQSKGSNVNKGKGIVGLKANPTEDEDNSESNPAFFEYHSKDIYINKEGDIISSNLYNYNILENILYHEKLHKDDNLRIVTDLQHASVYFRQMAHSSFKKSPESFQLSQVSMLMENLTKAANTEYQSRGTVTEAKIIVDQFNQTYSKDLKVRLYIKPDSEILMPDTEFKVQWYSLEKKKKK